jgi:hypothetical protein
MSKHTFLAIIGFLLLVSPFWGTPRDITIPVVQIIGFLLLVMGILSSLPKKRTEAVQQNGS